MSDPELRRKSHTCFFCGLYGERVEAGGIYFCPNPICPGPGGAWFRRKCKSYQEEEGGRHSVDTRELAEVGEWLLGGLPKGPERDAVTRSMGWLRDKMGE